jgi:hypothetical protein
MMHATTARRALPLLLALVVLALGVPPALANTSGGIRAGLSVNPDQFLFGGQLNFDPIGKNVYIVPSAELGLGDDLTTLSFNGDVQYRFHVSQGSSVRPYAGGGLSIWWFDPDGPGGSDTNVGVDVLGGIFFGEANGNPMFVDVKLDLTDELPDWKFVFGINF